MNGLIPALTGRGFAITVFRQGAVLTNPDPSAPVAVVITPSDTDPNDNVRVYLDGRKLATFYRQPDSTILALVDHLIDEGAKRKDGH